MPPGCPTLDGHHFAASTQEVRGGEARLASFARAWLAGGLQLVGGMHVTRRELPALRPLVRLGTVVAALAALGGVYAAVARPWIRRWGATDAELVQRLPGDEIVPAPRSQETRAITINAPASVVWGWVAQIGQDRAGFYSFRALENLFGCEMPDVQALTPALQRWKVGDKLWMYPPRKAGGAGFATLAVFEPGRALGFATRQIGRGLNDAPDASWSFIVKPVDAGTSRLILRGRGTGGLSLLPGAFTVAIFEPAHFAMEERMMMGIKQLAEGGRLSARRETLQVILWATVFAAFVASAFAVFRARRLSRSLSAFLAFGLLFQLLTLIQPHPSIGVALVLATTAASSC